MPEAVSGYITRVDEPQRLFSAEPQLAHVECALELLRLIESEPDVDVRLVWYVVDHLRRDVAQLRNTLWPRVDA